MNATQLTPEQLGDLKREFAHLMIGDMSPKELFEFAIHRITCDVALMKQEEPVSYTHLTLPTNREV